MSTWGGGGGGAGCDGVGESYALRFFTDENSPPRSRIIHLMTRSAPTTADLRAHLACLHAENLLFGRPTLHYVSEQGNGTSTNIDLSRGSVVLASLREGDGVLRCRYVVETWPQLLVQEAGGASAFVVPFPLSQSVAHFKHALHFISGIPKPQIILVLNNRVLQDNRSLVSYHVQRFTVLTLIRRDRIPVAA